MVGLKYYFWMEVIAMQGLVRIVKGRPLIKLGIAVLAASVLSIGGLGLGTSPSDPFQRVIGGLGTSPSDPIWRPFTFHDSQMLACSEHPCTEYDFVP